MNWWEKTVLILVPLAFLAIFIAERGKRREIRERKKREAVAERAAKAARAGKL